jgi:hypothetical protein
MTVRLGVGDALVEAGELTVRRLGRASTWRREHGGTIERALLETGAVTEEVLTSALSREYTLPGALREELAAADPDLVASLPARERRRLRALPFRHEGKLLHVAVSDPRNAVLGTFLEAASGFAISLHVAPDPVLEEFLDWFEKGRPDPAPPRIGPAPGARENSSVIHRRVALDSIEKLGKALVTDALRIGATELVLGADAHGGYVRTFDAVGAVLTRRLSGALLAPLAIWFKERCSKDGGFVVAFTLPDGATQRRRVELLAVGPQEARLRLAPTSGEKPAEVIGGCTHPKRRQGDVFCSQCGAVL